MTDPNKPDDSGIKERSRLTDPLASDTKEIREGTEAILTIPQLPAELRDRIEASDLKDAEGKDLKETALKLYDDINILLAHINHIPELSESVRELKDKLSSLTGRPLYERINTVLKSFDTMMRQLTKKAIDAQTGADYLQNTSDGSETPRIDMEKAIKFLENMRPLDEALIRLNPSAYFNEREKEVLQRMNDGDSQFIARYKMLRHLETQISAAIDKGDISENTAQLIIKATSGEMNLAYNVVGQHGYPLSIRIDEDDLGDSEAEKQLYLLSVYWHLLGSTEGIRFMRRFYE